MIPTFVQILFLTLLPLLAFAQATEQPQERVARLEHAVLAPCCYTESVAIHQSEIAVKMRLEIAKWVAAGKPDQEILDTYARIVRQQSPCRSPDHAAGMDALFPWLVLILGVFLMAWLVKHWSAAPRATDVLSTTELQNLPDFDDE